MVTINYETAKKLIPALSTGKSAEYIGEDDAEIVSGLLQDILEATREFESAPKWLNATFAFPLTSDHLSVLCWINPGDEA